MQRPEVVAERPRLLHCGRVESVLHLTQDLRLSEHHRIGRLAATLKIWRVASGPVRS